MAAPLRHLRTRSCTFIAESKMRQRTATEDVSFFVSLERQVWEALRCGDGAADARLLADDFLGVYESGFGSKPEHVAQVSNGPVVSAFDIEAPRLMRLGPELALLAYRACWRDAAQRPRSAYISSLWAHGAEGWRNVFSQDTNVEDAKQD
jgi:hypothetical protein